MTIYQASEVIKSNGQSGDQELKLRKITQTNDRDWAVGLEFIETNGDAVTENEEGFQELKESI